jgi:endonuclease-3
MSTPNRSALIAKLYKHLKKHYTAVTPDPQRPLLEQLVYACCLENATYHAADAAYKALTTQFFEWNEVRVSTARELSESLGMLPDAMAAANSVRKILQHVFETTYSFDLESLRKLNLGPATQKLEKMDGTTPFIVAYGVQTSLGGHSIPLDRGALETLHIVGVISEAEQASGSVPGLERAIPKNKGVEFGSLLHQLGAEVVANPFSTNLHKHLLEIAPDAKDRLPKRQAKKPEPPPPPAKKPAPAAREKAEPPSVAEAKAAAVPAPAKKKPAEPRRSQLPCPPRSPPPPRRLPAPASPRRSLVSIWVLPTAVAVDPLNGCPAPAGGAEQGHTWQPASVPEAGQQTPHCREQKESTAHPGGGATGQPP